ncbi:MAG TPA: type II toxin-antitoxin system VapC family toxin [Caulobacteraceae bacterium]
MSFLLDTNALSALVGDRPEPHFARWWDSVAEDDLFVSVLSIGEIQRGLARLAPGRRRRGLAEATDRLVAEYADRVLPIDEDIARRWGDLSARYRASGIVVGVVDELIAATALTANLVLVTRNVRHFDHAGCALLNPWPS